MESSNLTSDDDEVLTFMHARHHGPLQGQTNSHHTPIRARTVSSATVEPSSPAMPYYQSPSLASKSRISSNMSKSKRQRLRVYFYNCRRRLQKRRQFTLIFVIFFLILSILIYTLFWVFHHFQCYHREHGIVWREAPIHGMTRTCPPPTYETIAATSAKPQNICLTTLTDRQSPSLMQRMVRCRDFDALELISFPNQRAYASKHNYQWTDSSHMVDPSRPPAWSKILAVQHLLEQQACDWVLWLDADVLVMNSNVRIERLLPSDPNVMLVATHDRKYTVNSGVWLIRNSAWSRQFLKNWWNLKSWVRRPGLSLSGDNAAFGHLVDQVLRKEAWRVQIPARCNMNSFGVFLSETQYQNIVVNGGADALNKQEWYLSDQFYHQGDFIVHASGIDKKKEVLEMLLEKAI